MSVREKLFAAVYDGEYSPCIDMVGEDKHGGVFGPFPLAAGRGSDDGKVHGDMDGGKKVVEPSHMHDVGDDLQGLRVRGLAQALVEVRPAVALRHIFRLIDPHIRMAGFEDEESHIRSALGADAVLEGIVRRVAAEGTLDFPLLVDLNQTLDVFRLLTAENGDGQDVCGLFIDLRGKKAVYGIFKGVFIGNGEGKLFHGRIPREKELTKKESGTFSYRFPL